MYSYSKRSKENLATTHQLIQKIFNEAIRHYDISVLEGHRGEKEQNEAYEKGYSQVKFPYSKHNSNPSMAVDAVPFPIKWNDTKRMTHFAGIIIGISRVMLKGTGYKLISGIDWDGDGEILEHKFLDYPHFELVEDGTHISK